MNDKTPSPIPAAPTEPGAGAKFGGPGIRLDRRALLRAGAGATPVLLTLASNPVSAANSCVVASSYVSATTWASRNPTAASQSISCSARTLSGWKTYCSQSPTNGAVTVLLALGSTSPYGTTLRAVLLNTTGSGPVFALHQNLAAMYLSITLTGGIKSGWSMGKLDLTELRKVWSQCKGGGNYAPGSGISWTTAKVNQWLTLQMSG